MAQVLDGDTAPGLKGLRTVVFMNSGATSGTAPQARPGRARA